MRLRAPLAAAALALLAAAAAPRREAGLGGAAAHAAEPATRQASGARGGAAASATALGGVAVSALDANGALWLLVRPLGEPDGPRRLLVAGAPPPPPPAAPPRGGRARRRRPGGEGPAPVATSAAPPTTPGDLRPRELLAAVPGWVKTVAAADLGAGPELLVGGLGRVATLGPLHAPALPPRDLVSLRDVDLRSFHPDPLRHGVERWLPVASAGRVRLFAAAPGGLAERFTARLPIAVTAAGGGLRLASPPATAIDRGAGRMPLLAFGPAASGRSRLRVTLLDPEATGAGATEEAWGRLPGPESVEDHVVLHVDGIPLLVVRTQGSETLSAVERQRLRVLPLAPDRTRAGAAPTFAAEVDSRRWQPLALAAGDLDGDGRDDLVVAHPEGVRGNALVVESFAGQGGGRFAARSRRDDLPGPHGAFALLALAPGRLAVATVRERRLEVRPLGGGRDVAGRPLLAVTLTPPRAATPGARPPAGLEPGLAVWGLATVDSRATVVLVETAADGGQTLHLAPLPGGG